MFIGWVIGGTCVDQMERLSKEEKEKIIKEEIWGNMANPGCSY